MISGVGAGLFVFADGLVSSLPQVKSTSTQFLRVRVRYFQMARYISASDEYFDLQSPAHLSDLLNAVKSRHPSITLQMLASMMIFVNGTPSKTNVELLNDGDEVDLIPLVAGG
jgi:molybdopterin converting factor small subunit